MNKQKVSAELRRVEYQRYVAACRGSSTAELEGRAAELASYLEDEADIFDIVFPEPYPDVYGE